jgi:hypothetical protein
MLSRRDKMKYLVYWTEKHVLEVEAESAQEAYDRVQEGEEDISYSELVESSNWYVMDELAQGIILDKTDETESTYI